MSSSSLLATVALVGGLVATGWASPSLGQSAGQSPGQDPARDAARCQALYAQWSRYDGASHYSKQLDVDMAAEECRNGHASAGIADFRRILERGRIPLPATESAETAK
jgi:hypothetical protein